LQYSHLQAYYTHHTNLRPFDELNALSSKITQYIIKYKQKWERSVKESDEREKMRDSDEEIKCNG
jgi:hypothetical protein